MFRYFKLLGLLILLNFKSYGQSFYNITAIQKIEVHFNDPKWDYMLDTSKLSKEGYVMAQWVKINGVQYDSVGVRYKGNSSYDSTRLKNPIHIELDAYKNQDHQGYADIKLSNCYQDPSMIREVLAYKILKNYMHCPEANFAQVYINNTYMGVYSNTESINKVFCGNHFFSQDGTFIKGNPNVTPSANTKCNLKQLAGDSSAYFNFYEIKSDYGWKQLEALSDSVTNHPNTIANVMDVDRAIWMLAFNNVLINLDSYSGAFCQNYYLYKDRTKHYNPIVWDLNMSFGGFPFLGNLNTSLGSLTIPSMQVLPISAHSTDAYWPMIKAIYNNPLYKRMLVAHTRTMLNEIFVSNSYVTDYNQLKTLVDTAVLSDTRKFFTYTQFQNALTANYSVGSYSVPGIQTLMNGRIAYLQSTADFTVTTPTIAGVNNNATPALNTSVTFTANVTNANTVYFGYRFLLADKFTRIVMYDDGAHNDGAAGDNVYGTNIVMTGNQLQYYIYAENANAGIFSPERAEHEFHELKILQNPLPGQVVINEFLANNKSDVKNEFNLEEDWIELYNNTNTPLSLSNYYLSDENKDKAKFSFPNNTVIQPNGYLIVWADNVSLTGNQMHAPFKLNEDGDNIILSNGLRSVLDSVSFGNQTSDISIGRCPDGTGNFTSLPYPSYGMSNCTVGLAENGSGMNDFLIYPNPANLFFCIRTETINKQTLDITNALGQTIYRNNFSENIIINTSGWQNGLYLVKCNNATKKIIITN
ncbi:MAG: CotH kinase family protein [Bacteroidetes bacterium]|nr:CotH kinase family protein [Bacteroidota bacterium]